MSKMRIFLLVLLSLCVITSLVARGIRQKTPLVRVTGVVRLVGSSPFTRLVITGDENQWEIAKEDWDKLYDLQHRQVTVEGEETVTERFFANGEPAGEHRELKNINIVAVEQLE